MPITQGLTNIGSIFIGETPIKSVYQGTDLLYQSEITYELLYELDVTTAATQIDIEDLNIGKDDEVRLVYTMIGDDPSAYAAYSIYANNNTTATNYHVQILEGTGSTLGAQRQNTAGFNDGRSNVNSSGYIDIKVSNNDRFVAMAQTAYTVGAESSGIRNRAYNIVGSGFTLTSITSLSIICTNRTNGIAVGSKITLYKVNGGTA